MNEPSSPGGESPQRDNSNVTFALTVRRAHVTLGLIAVTVAVWLAQLVPGWDVLEWLAFVPPLAADQPWRFATAMFVHTQPAPTHLLFNMMGLLIFGSFVERTLGSVWFLLVYLVSGVGGSVLTLMMVIAGVSNPAAFYVGASGAVFGLVGVLLVPSKKLDRNWGGVVGFVLLNALMLFVVPNISWEAHLGGLVTGFALGAARLRTMGGR